MYLKRLGNSIAYFPNISELKDNTNRLYSIGGSLYFNGQEVGSGSGDASNTWTNANDHTTYTALSGLINTVNSNVDALPDSAANDYSTYTTLSGLINTVNANVDALPDSAANDYSTYTTLSGLIDTVNANVDALPDSAANDYSTYTSLSSLIDTVNANVDALPDSAANDYSTYTTVTANLYSTWNSLDTRINALDAGSNTSVSDLIAGIEGANTNIDTIQSNIDTSISTGSVIPASDNSGYVGNALFTWSSGRFTSFNIEEELEVGGSVTIEGNLTVSGNVVTVNASELSLEDNMIYLNANNTVTNPDLGFAGNYNDGTYQHAGFFRDATDGRWKVYEGYTLEPDESPYIDTSHGSFALATFEADEIVAAKAIINSVNVLSNDYATYTTLSSLINTVNSNVDALPDSAANDYSTYTTLYSLINTVNSNVNSLPDSAANELLIIGSDGTSIVSDDTLNIDPSNNYVGINQTSPEVTLHMTGEGAQTAQIRMEQYNDSVDAPDLRTRRYRGTIASPLAIQSGDYLYRSNHEYWNGSALIVGGQFAFDNANNANRTQFTVAVTTDGTSVEASTNDDVQFKIDGNDGGAITFNNAYKFPTSDGTSNQFLQTDGSGNLTFADIGIDPAANDYSTYTTLLGLINTVSANTSAAPDSAANDYTTYTTVTANLYNTYTTLNTAIDTVNGNVTPVNLDLLTPSANLTGVVGNALSTYSSGYFNNLNVVSTIYSDKILYSNMYSNEVDLPSATTYHGMFAHVHATGAGYFSHNGSWNKLIDNTTPTIAATTALVAGGATNPSTSTLHVTGNAYISSDTLIGGTLTESSSVRLKENIIPLNNQLDKLMLLRPVEYDKIDSRNHEYGLIAEEVANVIPQAVSLGNSAIQYTRLVPALISAIQELKLEIEELKRGSIIT